MLNGPQVNNGVLAAAMDGTFYDIDKMETYTITPAEFPLRDASGKSL